MAKGSKKKKRTQQGAPFATHTASYIVNTCMAAVQLMKRCRAMLITI